MMLVTPLAGTSAAEASAPAPTLVAPTFPAMPASRLKLEYPSVAFQGFGPQPRSAVPGVAMTGIGSTHSSSDYWYPANPSDAQWQEPLGPRTWPGDNTAPRKERPSKGADNRSGWARWNSSLLGVSATMALAAGSMVGAFTLLPSSVTGWDSPQFEGLKGNFTEGPRFDNDRFFFNYVAHPWVGSEYYLAARNRKCTWWQSLAYATAASTVFEFFIESAYERAAWQDLWITPVSGAVLGELRWQLKKSLEDPHEGKPIGTLNKVLYVLVDPMDGVYKL